MNPGGVGAPYGEIGLNVWWPIYLCPAAAAGICHLFGEH